MPTILWIIERLLVKPIEGSKTNVVITADWRCNGTQDQYNGTCYGSSSFSPPSGEFTPYDQLTQEQVLGWCYSNGVDKTAIEANVQQQIEAQINPPVVSPPLPWLPPAPPVEIVPPIIEQAVPVLVAEPVLIVDTAATEPVTEAKPEVLVSE
jgi:hypothetical protein